MARKARDYRAEERRRNERARAAGFTSRGQQRRAIASGKAAPLNPKRTEWFKAGFKSLRAYKRAVDDSEDWSAAHARHSIAEYNPDEYEPDIPAAVYTKAYSDAFVYGPERYANVRHSGGSDALFHFLVEVTGYLSAKEYDDKYPAD